MHSCCPPAPWSIGASALEALLLLVFNVSYRTAAEVGACTAVLGCLAFSGGLAWNCEDPPCLAPSLKSRGLRAGYGRRTVLENISIALAAGEWFVLLGPNGCGKTTLLDCVVSRLTPSGGEICIAGHSLRLALFRSQTAAWVRLRARCLAGAADGASVLGSACRRQGTQRARR